MESEELGVPSSKPLDRDPDHSAASFSPPPDLDLRPQPKIKRLNRVAILLVAIVAIVVLWAAYFVLSSRAPIGHPEEGKPRSGLQQQGLELERLQKSALSRQKELEPLFRMKPSPPKSPPPVTPTKRQVRPEPDRRRARLERALDAGVLAPSFTRSRPAQGLVNQNHDLPSDQQTRHGPTTATPQHETQRQSAAQVQPPIGAESDPGLLAQKEEFLRRTREAGRSSHLATTIRQPVSPFELRQGTLIPAILLTGINSDLPGQCQALVRRDVFDSTTGRYLLIPQGSRLIGEYDNRVAWGQKRVLLAWHRLILPDGRSLDLRGMPGADLAAMAGIRDKVNNHFVRTFGSALLLSAITAGVQLSQPQESSFGASPSASQIAAAALGQEIGRVTSQITRRNVNIQPTLEIRPGYLFNVEVTEDVLLPGPFANLARVPPRSPR